MTLPADYHTHTHLCKHAHGEPEEYADAAEARNLLHFAATDHAPTDDDYSPDDRMSMQEYEQYRDWLNRLRTERGDFVRMGVEADFYHGCYAKLLRWLEDESLDVVLGAVHFQNYWAPKLEWQTLWHHEDIKTIWKRYFKLVGLMAETGLYDVAAHIDLPKKQGKKPDEDFIRECCLPALDKIAEKGMSLEVNTSGLIHRCREIYPSQSILGWAKERDITIVFGSNAHEPARVGGDFNRAVVYAKEAGYTEYATYLKREKTMVTLD